MKCPNLLMAKTPTKGRKLDLYNPATGAVIGVDVADKCSVEQAVVAAKCRLVETTPARQKFYFV